MRTLIVQYSANRDGSAFSALMLANGLRRHGCETHVVFGFRGPIIAEFEQAGHTVHVMDHKNWLRSHHLLRTLRYAAKEVLRAKPLLSLMRRVQPNMTYVNTSVSLCGAIAGRLHGTPVIWHIRELLSNVGGELVVPRPLLPVVRICFRTLATRIVVNSAAVAKNVLGSVSRVEIVPNAVSSRFFEDNRSMAEARAGFDLPTDAIVVGVPGTLRPMKGHQFFLSALARLVHQFPGLVAPITGDGAPGYVRALKDEVHALGIEAHVRFLGSTSDMVGFYRACDLVCIPSQAEPFGRTVIEAFAAGTPVVATAVGGMQELVEPGVTGELVAYGDNEQLVGRISNSIKNVARRKAMADAARRQAERAYREEIYEDRLVRIVQDVAARQIS